MRTTFEHDSKALPELPHWEVTPDDLGDAVRQVKAAIRTRIAASGRSVDEVFAVIEQRVRADVDDILATRARGQDRLASRPLHRHRGRDRRCRDGGTPPAPRLPDRARSLRPGTGARLGRRHRRLRREQPVLRDVPRSRRRLLRERGLEARDLPDLLVPRADAGTPERPHGPRPAVPQSAVDQCEGRRSVVRPRP